MTASVVVGSSIVMTVTSGPQVFGIPIFTVLGSLGYLLAFVNSVWVVLSIWRRGRTESDTARSVSTQASPTPPT
jgi:ubiquinone biosynthesis protein